MKQGQVGILNVGTGDTKLSFDKNNPAERIRAARIVTDMIRRGYALLVEVERNGEKAFQRVEKFDEDKCEYIIADFDPVTAAEQDAAEAESNEENQEQQAPAAPPAKSLSLKKRGPSTKRLDAATTRAVAVPRRAGG